MMAETTVPAVAIVDDDPRVGLSLQNLLESAGISVQYFTSAEGFLDANVLGRIVCLISDIWMPGMDGIELQRYVRNSSPDLPIILMTAHSEDDVRRHALVMGAFRFMEKPFDGDELIEAVKLAIDQPRHPKDLNSGEAI